MTFGLEIRLSRIESRQVMSGNAAAARHAQRYGSQHYRMDKFTRQTPDGQLLDFGRLGLGRLRFHRLIRTQAFDPIFKASDSLSETFAKLRQFAGTKDQ